MFFRKNKNTLDNSEKGAAAVEFALLVPLLALVLMGIIIFGLVFNAYLEITHAAREGARWISIGKEMSVVEQRIRDSAPGIDWSRATITRSGVMSDPPTVDDQRQPVTITITYDISNITAIFGPIQGIFQSTIITGEATQMVE